MKKNKNLIVNCTNLLLRPKLPNIKSLNDPAERMCGNFLITILLSLNILVVHASASKSSTGKAFNSLVKSINHDYDFENICSGDHIVINGVIDLKGGAIDFPRKVTIDVLNGGVINGTLNFAEDTVISGELLNGSLKINGDETTISNEVFYFEPKRWGIVEGVVSDEVAYKNKEIIQNFINQVVGYGVTTVVIDKMDCYIGVGGNWSLGEQTLNDGISLPSNFKLQMSENTFIRVQPNRWPRYNVLNAYKKENIEINGGNIIGDRFTHDYAPISDEFGLSRNSHEWGTLVVIAGSHNVVVDGVTMKDSSGDGFVFASGTNRQYNPPIFCKNVFLKNCTIDNSRRNNITIGDGEYLYIENCKINNAGGGENILDENGKIKTYTSAGVAPQLGIDMEAHREVENGEYVSYQIIEHVFVRGNIFRGNYTGDIVVFTANDVVIENNDCDNLIGGSLFWNTTIRNNVLKQRIGGVKTSIGILFNPISDFTKVNNNVIIGNSISGFDTGISAFGQNFTIKNNSIRDFKEAIFLRKLYNSEISSNDYQSERTISYGYLSFGGSTSNVVIKNDKINVLHRPLYLFNFNKKTPEDHLTIENCEFTSPKELYLDLTNNVTIRNNTLTQNKEIRQVNCINVVLQNN